MYNRVYGGTLLLLDVPPPCRLEKEYLYRKEKQALENTELIVSVSSLSYNSVGSFGKGSLVPRPAPRIFVAFRTARHFALQATKAAWGAGLGARVWQGSTPS